jgi:hypothetical protein
MAFKMKGSPMYRNFGIGKPSPNKQATISSVSDSLQNKPNPAIEKLIKELEETQDSTNNANQAELERRAKQIQQNVSPKEFNKQIEEHNEKNSPAKQGVRDPNKDYSDPEVLKKEREQNQAIYDQRTGKYKRDKKANKQMLRPRKKEEENVKSPSKQFEEGDYYDTRSKSPSKQFEEGDYYDTRSKSPNKQKHLGGTKSGKGNVFTKRGRTQRKLNKSQDEQNKLRSEHIAENKRSTELATKAHKEKMIKKQLKNRPKTVVMKGDKDVTDQYR